MQWNGLYGLVHVELEPCNPRLGQSVMGCMDMLGLHEWESGALENAACFCLGSRVFGRVRFRKIGREPDLKTKTASSDSKLASFGKVEFEAFRGRIGKNVKHESCREGFFLGGNVDSFLKWGSKCLSFYENLSLTVPRISAQPGEFNRQ